MTPGLEEMKEGTKALWSLGDYRKIALLTDQAAEALVDACAISAGQEVLDVAAGTGNVAVRAAKEGAAVTASDLTPRLVEWGRERSKEEGLDIAWDVADVEDLPYEDASFDTVTSVFGAMFAPRPEVAAAEMFRVVRPGGTVGMANWVPESFIGRMFALSTEFMPSPPGQIPRATEWGEEDIVRQRFADLAGTVEIETRTARWEYGTRDEAWSYAEENAGPQVAARAALTEQGRYDEFRDRALRILDEMGREEDGTFVVEGDYLVVVARKRG